MVEEYTFSKLLVLKLESISWLAQHPKQSH
jgi:hypothetical protein